MTPVGCLRWSKELGISRVNKNRKEHTISYSSYARILKEQNIGCTKPSTDQCLTCILSKKYKHGEPESVDKGNDCILRKNYQIHDEIAAEARDEYQRDVAKQWGEGSRCIAVDMQKVIMLPKMNIKEHFFVSRLTVFNETFASLSGDEDMCVLWHEALSGRDASDVTSAYYQAIINSSNCNRFTFWADNCCAQNKNWTLFSTFVSLVNSVDGPEEITMKYFEPGHTYMRADSVHGSIGKNEKDWTNFELEWLQKIGFKCNRNYQSYWDKRFFWARRLSQTRIKKSATFFVERCASGCFQKRFDFTVIQISG